MKKQTLKALFIVLCLIAYKTVTLASTFTAIPGTTDLDHQGEKVTIDTVVDSACMASAHLEATFTGTGFGSKCNFSSTVYDVPVSGYGIIGYYWTLPAPSGNFFVSSVALSNTQTFSLSNNTSFGISVTIYAKDSTTHDTCSKVTLNRTATCTAGHGTVSAIKVVNPSGEADMRQSNEVTEAVTEAVKVFPNPASDVVNISSLNQDISSIQIFNMVGEKVAEYSFGNVGQATVYLDNIPNGIYMLRVNNSHQQFINKIAR